MIAPILLALTLATAVAPSAPAPAPTPTWSAADDCTSKNMDNYDVAIQKKETDKAFADITNDFLACASLSKTEKDPADTYTNLMGAAYSETRIGLLHYLHNKQPDSIKHLKLAQFYVGQAMPILNECMVDYECSKEPMMIAINKSAQDFIKFLNTNIARVKKGEDLKLE